MVATFLISSFDEIIFVRAFIAAGYAAEWSEEVSNAVGNPFVHAAHLEVCSDRFAALRKDSARENRRGRRTVASNIVRFVRNLANKLRTNVLVAVLEIDTFGDGYAVFCDLWCPVSLVKHNIAALRAKRHLYSVGQLVHAGQHHRTRLITEADIFARHMPPERARHQGARLVSSHCSADGHQ